MLRDRGKGVERLVFSITFSEKIVGFPNASVLAKTLLLAAWGLLIVSIVGSGDGLHFIFNAGLAAKHGSPESEYISLINSSYTVLNVAGIRLLW